MWAQLEIKAKQPWCMKAGRWQEGGVHPLSSSPVIFSPVVEKIQCLGAVVPMSGIACEWHLKNLSISFWSAGGGLLSLEAVCNQGLFEAKLWSYLKISKLNRILSFIHMSKILPGSQSLISSLKSSWSSGFRGQDPRSQEPGLLNLFHTVLGTVFNGCYRVASSKAFAR